MRQLWKSTDGAIDRPTIRPAFLYVLLSHCQVITTIWIRARCTWEAGLRRKESKRYLIKRRVSDFAVTRKRMDRSPPLVLSFSTETRKPDKLAIRKVIWQAAQSAFAAPLHLLNIMKPCSVPLVNIRLAWKDYRQTGQRGSLNFALVNQLSARC